MKNNVSYYRREARSFDLWQFKMLRKKYGWEGDSKFWALADIIAFEENCTLDINDEVRMMAVCADLDFDPEQLLTFVQFLCEHVKLIAYDEGLITSHIVQDCFDEVMANRTYYRNYQRTVKKKQPVPVCDKANLNGEGAILNGGVLHLTDADTNLNNSNTTVNNNDAMPATAVQKTFNINANLNAASKVNTAYNTNLKTGNATLKQDFLTLKNKHSIIKENKEIKEKRESNTAPSTVARPPSYSDEDMDGFRKFTDWIANKTPCVALMQEPFTIDQYVALGTKHQLGPDEIKHLLTVMHNWPPLVKHNRSAYYTLLKWKKREGNR